LPLLDLRVSLNLFVERGESIGNFLVFSSFLDEMTGTFFVATLERSCV